MLFWLVVVLLDKQRGKGITVCGREFAALLVVQVGAALTANALAR